MSDINGNDEPNRPLSRKGLEDLKHKVGSLATRDMDITVRVIKEWLKEK